MKKLLKVLIIVCIFGVFTLECSAKTAEDYIGEAGEIVPEEYRDFMIGMGTGELNIAGLLSEVLSIISGEAPTFVRLLCAFLGVCLLFGVADGVPERIRSETGRAVSVTCALFVGVSVSDALLSLSDALAGTGAFFSSAVPVLSAITLAGGGVNSAAAQASGMNFVLSLVGGGFGAVLSVTSGFCFAMGLGASVGGEGNLAVGRFSRSLFLWLFGIATALIMGLLSLQTLVAASADSASMRTARYLISGSVPLVGGTVSASLSTLASGLSYAKGVVGAGFIAVLFLIFLPPLLLSLCYRLALSLASGISSLLGIGGAERCFSSFRSSFDIFIGIYCLGCVLYIFEMVLFIKSGVAIL